LKRRREEERKVEKGFKLKAESEKPKA